MSLSLLSLPREIRDKIWAEVLSVDKLQTVEETWDRDDYELKWKASTEVFTVGRELSQDAVRYFYEENMFVEIYSNDSWFLELLNKVIPTLQRHPRRSPLDKLTTLSKVALSISIYSESSVFSEGSRSIIIAGTHLPRFIQLVNSLGAPFKARCLGGVENDLEHGIRFQGRQFSFLFNCGPGHYADKPHIATKLAYHLREFRLPGGGVFVLQNPAIDSLYTLSRTLLQSSNAPRFPTAQGYIAQSEFWKRRGDYLAGQDDDDLYAARAAYTVAGLMICKRSFPKLEHSLFSNKWLPDPEILHLSLQLWLAASKLSVRMSLYREALLSAETAYLVSQRTHSPASSQLRLDIALQYAHILLEQQRHYNRGEEIEWDGRWTKRVEQSIRRRAPLHAFDHARSILQGAFDRNPDSEEIREKLAACKALRPKPKQKPKTRHAYLQRKFRQGLNDIKFIFNDGKWNDGQEVVYTPFPTAIDAEDILSSASGLSWNL